MIEPSSTPDTTLRCLTCTGLTVEHQPSVYLDPFDGRIRADRRYRCPTCLTWQHITVTDPTEVDNLFAATFVNDLPFPPCPCCILGGQP